MRKIPIIAIAAIAAALGGTTTAIASTPTADTITFTNPGGNYGLTWELNQSSLDYGGIKVFAKSSEGLPVTFSATGLPVGVSLDQGSYESGGLTWGSYESFSGTLPQPGIFLVPVTATDSTGATAQVTFDFRVADQIMISNPGNQVSVAGSEVSLRIHATSTAGSPLTYADPRAGFVMPQQPLLPTGLSIDSSTGVISGKAQAGQWEVQVQVTDTFGADVISEGFLWTVTAPPADKLTVANPGNRTSVIGKTVSLQLHATSSTGSPLTYTTSRLPKSVVLSRSGVLIYGKVTGPPGNLPVTVKVRDRAGSTAQAKFTWTIKR